jgi:hypothetical protein
VKTYPTKRKDVSVRQLSPVKSGLFLALIETGSPYLPSFLVVHVTRWMSIFLGLLSSNRT